MIPSSIHVDHNRTTILLKRNIEGIKNDSDNLEISLQSSVVIALRIGMHALEDIH
jgi:hypothetical protein